MGTRLNIYSVEYGVFGDSLDTKLGSIKSIRDNLEKVIGKFIQYDNSIFSRVQLE